MEIRELSSILRQNGIVGAGGAGFPTYAKLDSRAKTILLNCAECEPLLKLHRQLLNQYAEEIAGTFQLMAQALGAERAIIGIKKAYKSTISALEACIGAYPAVELGLLEEVYPAGDEVVLIHELTGCTVRPGGLPIESGIAVFNVETVYNVYRAVKKQEPVTEKFITIVGEVRQPVTRRVPIGIPLKEVVELAGGSNLEEPVYFVGGPMMGMIGNPNQPVTKTTNAILVLPENHQLVMKKRRKTSIDLKRAAASCCQCTMCTDLCPRHLLGHPIEPHKFMRAATLKDIQDPDIFLNTQYCSSCGVCENYACMQGLSPRSLIADYKTGLKEHGITPSKELQADRTDPARELRKVPMERLMARLDLTRYEKEVPFEETEVVTDRVKILLRQHIGAPAAAIVEAGAQVQKGDLIAVPAEGLSVGIHSSITGTVTEVTSQHIVIRR